MELLPGERAVRVLQRDPPASGFPLFEGLLRFFQEAVPAELLQITEAGDASRSFKAVAFIDYGHVHVEVRLLSVGENKHHLESAGLRPMMSNDIVRFHELFSLVELFLRSCGFEIAEGGEATRLNTGGLIDVSNDFFMDDDLVEDDLALSWRVKPLLDDLLPPPVNMIPSYGRSGGSLVEMREDAAQGLARLAETGSLAISIALARAMIQHADQVMRLLMPAASDPAVLAVTYPLLVALKFAALNSEAAEMLASSGFPERLEKTRFHGLLAREVDQTLQAIKDAHEKASRSLDLPTCSFSRYTSCSTSCSVSDLPDATYVPKKHQFDSDRSTERWQGLAVAVP
jgi:hypothetical protein